MTTTSTSLSTQGSTARGATGFQPQPVQVGTRERRGVVRVVPEAYGHRARPGLDQPGGPLRRPIRSEEHTPELQSRQYLVCRLLLEQKHIHFLSSSVCTSVTPI